MHSNFAREIRRPDFRLSRGQERPAPQLHAHLDYQKLFYLLSEGRTPRELIGSILKAEDGVGVEES